MSNDTFVIEKNIKLNLNLDELFQKIDNCDKDDHITLKLSQIDFVSPETLIILVTASKIIYDKTGNTVEWSEINPKTYSYLERIDAGKFNFIKLKKPASAKKLHRSKISENLVELSVITDWKEMGDAIQKTKGVINKWLPRKSIKYRNDLITLLKETVENSIDHSGERPKEGVCYYVVQKYERSNGKVEIQIAVGDIGVGMLTSLRRVFPETKTDVNAIWGAFVDGKSGREMGGGLGYHSIKEALSNLRGSISIRSGMGIIYYAHGSNRPYIYRKKVKYPGTQIVFHCKG